MRFLKNSVLVEHAPGNVHCKRFRIDGVYDESFADLFICYYVFGGAALLSKNMTTDTKRFADFAFSVNGFALPLKVDVSSPYIT